MLFARKLMTPDREPGLVSLADCRCGTVARGYDGGICADCGGAVLTVEEREATLSALSSTERGK